MINSLWYFVFSSCNAVMKNIFSRISCFVLFIYCKLQNYACNY